MMKIMLALTLAKKVESEVGKRSTFTFIWPIH
jgi:hypothetical protein